MSKSRVAENLERVRERIARATQRSGRRADSVKLVAVTKYVDVQTTRWLVEAGCVNLGESRPQELWRKSEELNDLSVEWHLIGHLQRNKAKRTLPLVTLIHSMDSRRLMVAVNELAETRISPVPVMVEVNISGDPTKHGFAPDDLEPLLQELPNCQNLVVRGLMTMAALAGGEDGTRADFARLRDLRDRLIPHLPMGTNLDELSMGMSRDFELAIAEGATIVRVGSALFEGIAS